MDAAGGTVMDYIDVVKPAHERKLILTITKIRSANLILSS